MTDNRDHAFQVSQRRTACGTDNRAHMPGTAGTDHQQLQRRNVRR